MDNEEHNLIVYVGDIINNYQVVDFLGQGISGRVYEVYKDSNINNKMNDFISKMKYDNEIKNKTENNIIWLKKQIDELFPYKKKCIMLNKEINKLQNQCDIIKTNHINRRKTRYI